MRDDGRRLRAGLGSARPGRARTRVSARRVAPGLALALLCAAPARADVFPAPNPEFTEAKPWWPERWRVYGAIAFGRASGGGEGAATMALGAVAGARAHGPVEFGVRALGGRGRALMASLRLGFDFGRWGLGACIAAGPGLAVSTAESSAVAAWTLVSQALLDVRARAGPVWFGLAAGSLFFPGVTRTYLDPAEGDDRVTLGSFVPELRVGAVF